jgi:hypothetical protein
MQTLVMRHLRLATLRLRLATLRLRLAMRRLRRAMPRRRHHHLLSSSRLVPRILISGVDIAIAGTATRGTVRAGTGVATRGARALAGEAQSAGVAGEADPAGTVDQVFAADIVVDIITAESKTAGGTSPLTRKNCCRASSTEAP